MFASNTWFGIQGFGFRVSGFGFRVANFGLGFSGSGFRVNTTLLRAENIVSGLSVSPTDSQLTGPTAAQAQDLCMRVPYMYTWRGSGLRVEGGGFRVQGSGSRV